MLVVVAETIEDAKQQAKSGAVYSYGIYKQYSTRETIELGDPTRIVDLPCAEWHEWQE